MTEKTKVKLKILFRRVTQIAEELQPPLLSNHPRDHLDQPQGYFYEGRKDAHWCSNTSVKSCS